MTIKQVKLFFFRQVNGYGLIELKAPDGFNAFFHENPEEFMVSHQFWYVYLVIIHNLFSNAASRRSECVTLTILLSGVDIVESISCKSRISKPFDNLQESQISNGYGML